MSLSAEIREQLLRSFRAELSEHIQTITDGLLALEQRQLEGDARKAALENIFRAAHSLKGAARAVGATAVEQVAHALESALDGLRSGTLEPGPDLFTACYGALDAIRIVQSSYEAGEVTPPVEALQALAGLARFQHPRKPAEVQPEQSAPDRPAAQVEPQPEGKPPEPADDVQKSTPAAAPLTTRRIEEVFAKSLAGIAEEPDKPRDAEGQVAVESVAQSPKAEPAYIATNDETVRVSVNKLDALMAQLSELLVTKMRIEQRRAQIRQFQEFIGLWQKEWLNARSSYSRLSRQNGVDGDGHEKDLAHLMEFLSVNQDHLRQMGTWINDLGREYNNDSLQMSLVVDRLEEEIKRVRMLPLNTITGPFPRMVRDLAQELGREAVLEISGADTELDKQVLEGIKDPLVHLLRNAIDHGIEPPDKRAAAGKPRVGTIRLSAEQQGKDVMIAVSDDGAGLDLEAIRRSVAKKNGAAKDAHVLEESELIEVMFQTGISSSTIVTGISGRGVGLDVVRRNVEALNGRIEVEDVPGKGVTFRMILPLRLTGSHGLLVRVSGQLFILPINVVERILTVTPAEIITLEGRDAIIYNNRPVTLIPLEAVLELPRLATKANGNNEQPTRQVVVMGIAERKIAFTIDELSGEQEVVIKDLGNMLRRVGGIAGASVMGSGEVVLILNPNDLIRMAVRVGNYPVFSRAEEEELAASGASEEAGPEHKRVLVVDDSITTRTLEKNILEAAGYTVQVATDGEEVLSIIATDGLPDLLISDITMPRMNGFELTRRVKSDPQMSQIPVILVTSLESPEDKARGIEVGADAYIVKGRFDQNHLLETVEQLI